MAISNSVKKNSKEILDNWIIDAAKKGYSSRELRKVLLKKGFTGKQMIEVIEEFERLREEHRINPVSDEETPKTSPIVSINKTGNTATVIKPEIKKLPVVNIVIPQDSKKVKKVDKVLSVVETYELLVDKAKVEIRIEKRDDGLVYSLYFPEVDVATKAFLNEIRKELISVTALAIGEIADQKSVLALKRRFMADATQIIRKKIINLPPENEDYLVGLLMQNMLGLGRIEFLLNDPNLEEIVIVNSKEIRIYHKKYGWLSTNIDLEAEDDVVNYANIIARRVGRQISILTPLLDAHVVTGDRANAVLYPIATKGNTITIRKFARDPWTIIDLINNKTISKDIAALLWLAIEYEMNVIFSGGTASGKTVCLNACMPFIPPNHRIISMEDTRELMLPKFLYWTPLVTRTPNAENKGEVSMLDLLVNSLRMRPDRIILGEIRRQREAEVLFEAMHTGHSVYATVHADTASETIRRLTNAPISIPPSMLSSVNLNVVMFRDRRLGVRKAFQLAEYLQGKENVTANLLYRWSPEKDEFVPHNKSLAFYDELSRNTGMDEKEIEKRINYKKAIFDWMIKNKIRDLQSLGKVINLYYTDRERLESIMKNNRIADIFEVENHNEI